MKILGFIIGIVAYFVLSFTFKDIGLSFYDDVSLKEYRIVEIWATLIATITSAFIGRTIATKGNFGNAFFLSLFLGFGLFVVTVIISLLPISTGFVILFNIINIIFIGILTLMNNLE